MAPKFYRINQRIIAPTVRLIDSDGKQIGVVKINEALQKAQDEGLDLVEIAPQANPPVVRILDFEKFKYERERQEKEAKRKIREVETKEVRFGPFVSQHDLENRLKRVKDFLKKGNKVKLTVKFTGRQMAHTEFGSQLLDRIIKELETKAKTEQNRRFLGRQLSIIITPKVKG